MVHSRIVRPTLFAIALVLVTAAFVTWPITGTTAGLLPPAPFFARATPQARDAVDASFVPPLRDPFVGMPGRASGVGAAPSPSARATPSNAYAPIPGLPILPANVGAGSPQLGVLGARPARTPAEADTVRAVVVGRHAFALVAVGGAIRMVAVGDPIDDDVVAAIDERGVTLASGTRLPLRPPPADDPRKESP